MKAGEVCVRLLGTAAGGGLPQWNCACQNCQDARNGRIPQRGQCSVALGSGGRWLLINAPPDLSTLMTKEARLQPLSDSPRNSRIAGVFLTSADLDHVLGIFSLREGERLSIYATAHIRQTLESSLGLTTILESFCGVTWHEALLAEFTPTCSEAEGGGDLHYRAIPLCGHAPRFARGEMTDGTNRVAYEFINRATGGRLVVAPDVSDMNPALQSALQQSDIALFDGTFWSETELAGINPRAAPASQMGHMPMQRSLPILQGIPALHKAYVHINNTNPAIRPDSEERIAIETAGVIIPNDGDELLL